MFLDHQLLFSKAQAITVTATATNHVDLGQLAGQGYPLRIHMNVQTSFVGTGSSLTVEFVTRPGTTGTWRKHWRAVNGWATASLTAGFKLDLPNVPNTTDRYAALRYVVSSTFTAGNMDAGIVLDRQSNEYDAGRADVGLLVP